MMERRELLSRLRADVDYPVSEDVDLGGLILTVNAATSHFPALRYFSRARQPAGRGERRHSLYWLPESRLPADLLAEARRQVDRTFRAERFRQGFYLTHHHGDPALLFVERDATYVIGGDPSKVVWSYLVKVVLTSHAWRTDQLHLKATALTADGRTLLVVGPGSGGKTFLTLQACGAGGTLLANTHVLLTPRTTRGVAAAIRVRPDPAYDWLLRRAHVAPHYEGDDVIIDPVDAGIDIGYLAPPPSAILIMNYSGTGKRGVSPLDPAESRAMLEHFAWPMNVYGMKYDVWEMVGASPAGLRRYVEAEGQRLDALVDSAPSLLIDWEITGPQDVTELLETVAGYSRGR